MGTVNHDFLTVHSWNRDAVAAAHVEAVRIFGALVTPIMKTTVNQYDGFTVWDCGSKLGWTERDQHDERLKEFTAWLGNYRTPHDNVSWRYNPLRWFHVWTCEEDDHEPLIEGWNGPDGGDR